MRERDEPLEAAGWASQARKAVCEDAAVEIPAELLFHECGVAGAVCARLPGLRQE